jgi:hypothetical protein
LGTAIIIFAFRAVPLPGPGATWFEIDVLRFDQQFLSVLSLIGSGLTLAGMFVLRPVLAKRSLAYVIALLALASAVLSLPNISLFSGSTSGPPRKPAASWMLGSSLLSIPRWNRPWGRSP